MSKHQKLALGAAAAAAAVGVFVYSKRLVIVIITINIIIVTVIIVILMVFMAIIRIIDPVTMLTVLPQHYYPDYDIGLWTFCASVFGGSFGVFAGGFFSDRLVKVMLGR